MFWLSIFFIIFRSKKWIFSVRSQFWRCLIPFGHPNQTFWKSKFWSKNWCFFVLKMDSLRFQVVWGTKISSTVHFGSNSMKFNPLNALKSNPKSSNFDFPNVWPRCSKQSSKCWIVHCLPGNTGWNHHWVYRSHKRVEFPICFGKGWPNHQPFQAQSEPFRRTLPRRVHRKGSNHSLI